MRRDGPEHRHDVDRSFQELLQELRVAQTGVQVFFAFLLTIPFAPGFEKLDHAQRVLYAVDVLLVVLAMAFLVSPVAIHRAIFGRRMRPELVRVAHAVTLIGLSLLLLAVSAGVLLVATVVFPPGESGRVWLPAASFVGLLLCWIALPLTVRAARGTLFEGDPD